MTLWYNIDLLETIYSNLHNLVKLLKGLAKPTFYFKSKRCVVTYCETCHEVVIDLIDLQRGPIVTIYTINPKVVSNYL
jgi:hypothetical protein